MKSHLNDTTHATFSLQVGVFITPYTVYTSQITSMVDLLIYLVWPPTYIFSARSTILLQEIQTHEERSHSQYTEYHGSMADRQLFDRN